MSNGEPVERTWWQRVVSYGQKQISADRPHDHATCQARLGHADTGVADDAGGRKGIEGSAPEKTADADGSGSGCESENHAPGIAAEAAGCPERRALAPGVGFLISFRKNA
jgi:hypothetical protein